MAEKTKPYRHAETVNVQAVDPTAPTKAPLGLTILSHPNPGRIGQVARLDAYGRGAAIPVSRLEPLFESIRAPAGAAGEPLADSRLSRKPVLLTPTAAGVWIDPAGTSTRVELDGDALTEALHISVDDMEKGRVIGLGRTITLLLHRLAPRGGQAVASWLSGESGAIERVRSEIARVADLGVPVMLRGESGSGKELVARALHQQSKRRGGPFVAVNMAAVTTSTAASELFGHVRGAFTGASRDHDGFFARADGGTLFLDEIGDTPAELQPMLLRVLETGELQPVGGSRVRRVDVRVVAATDLDLDSMLGNGFRAPLFHRLSGYTIQVPPLRARRDDIARLFLTFLTEELGNTGDDHHLAARAETEPPFITTELMAVLLRHPWPGNVRELRNVARHIAIASRGSGVLLIPQLRSTGTAKAGSGPISVASPEPLSERSRAPASDAKANRVRPSELDDDALFDALEAHAWKPGPTAEALGISRTTLYALIDRSPRIRKARDVPDEEVADALASSGGDLDHAAIALKVSKRGLQLRLKERQTPT